MAMPTGYLLLLALALGTPCQFVIGATSSTTSGTSTIEANSSVPPYSSNSSSSYSYDFHPGYPVCSSYDELSSVGDGHCDTDLNIASCGWDGGDCCVCTCTSTAYHDDACPDDDRDCEDPLAPLHLEDPDCQNVSFQEPEVARCPQDQVYVVINDTAGATVLAEATLCSGGYFEVEWIGHVNINKTIHVLDGTHLHINGTPDAVVDGGGRVQIFLVYNASLNLNSIEVVKGTSSEGGAIILAAGSNLFANDVAFKSNTAYTTGGAVYVKSSIFELVSTTFVKNSAGGAGGAIYADGSEISWTGTTLLEQNKAFYGGALYLDNGATVTSKGVTVFESNEVNISGGAIGAAKGGGEFRVTGTTIFTNNTSGDNGGAIECSNIYLVIDGNLSFSHNFARFGGALYAFQVDVGPKLTGVTFSDNTAESGGAVYLSAVGTNPFIYSRYDEYFAYYSSRFDGCRFNGNSASSTGGAIHSEGGSGYLVNTIFVGNWAEFGGAIKSFGLTFFYNSSFEDNMSGPDGGPAVSNRGVISSMSGIFFTGNAFFCSSDTFMDFTQSSTEYSQFDTVCNGCDVKCEGCTVEDNGSTPVCSDLLPHTDSKGGTATLETLVLDPGYWRATNTSRTIRPCFNKKACRGGVTGSPNFCSTGYEGPYCAACRQGFIRDRGSSICTKCATYFGTSISFVLLGFAGLLVLLFVYYMILYEGESATWQHQFLNRLSKILAVQSFKIIIVNWQIITQFSDATEVEYPTLYKELLGAVVLVNFDFLSAWCIDVDFYNGLIVTTAGPLAVVALLGVTYIVGLRRNRGSETGRRLVRQKHINAVIVLFFLVYSSASSAIFKVFACNSLDDGNVYFRADYRVTCTSSKHKAFMIYAESLIAVYPLGIPVLFAILLLRNRKFLENAALRTNNRELVLQSTSSLWKPYKPSVFYYEVVECARRLTLGGIIVFIYPDSVAQICMVLVMALTFSLASASFNPYESRADSWVARIGHVMVAMTMFVAFLSKVDVSNEGTQLQNILAVILVTAHIAMILIGIIEAVRVFGSVQQNDIRLPGLRTLSLCPVDSFPSIHSYHTGRRLSGQA